MSDTIRSAADRFDVEKRTYERLVWGLVAIGCLGLVGGMLANEHLAGTATYLVAVWIGVAIAFGLPRVSDRTLYDERDRALHDRASGLAIVITFVAGLAVVPALYVLDAGGQFAITPTAWGAIYLLSALGLLYGACFTLVDRRY